MSNKPIPLEVARELAQLYTESDTLTTLLYKYNPETDHFKVIQKASVTISDRIWEIVSKFRPSDEE